MRRGIISSLIGLLLVFMTALPVVAYNPYPMYPVDTQVADALDYLRGEQTVDGDIGGFAASAWVAMAIVAAGENPHDWKTDPANPSIVDYLEANVGSAANITDYERMILAITASGENPSSFGGVDFVALVEAGYDGTQIGDAGMINDDFWGAMSLITAGVSINEPIITGVVSFIKANQNTDGGWGWSVGSDSDADNTAAAVMALLSAGEDATSAEITAGLAYIKTTQMDNGGFESWGSTNADTDSWSTMAIVAAGQDPTSLLWRSSSGNDPIDDLLTFQQQSGDPDAGAFYWQSGNPGMSAAKTTASAIQALLGKPWPVGGHTISVQIEGQTSTVWDGDVTVYQSQIYCYNSAITHSMLQPTAIGALDKAAQLGGFDYTATDAYGSPFVDSINGEASAGTDGWQYWIDYESPAIGAADFLLGVTTPPVIPHEEELWGYGGFPLYPLHIASDSYSVAVDEEFILTVTDGGGPVGDATIYVDGVAHGTTTDPSGEVTLSVDHETTVEIYTDKAAFVRSSKITVTVEGSAPPPPGNLTSLGANILPTIAITVDPSTINFGDLGPGDVSSVQQVTITNDGTVTVDVTAEVTDNANNLYVDGLYLDVEIWSAFTTQIDKSNSDQTDATLHVPADYAGVGEKSGTMIFWATPV